MLSRALLVVFLVTSVVACQKQSSGGPGTYQVVITSYDQDKKITAVKAVRDNTGMGLAEAKRAVEAAPATVKKGLSQDEAGRLAKTLEESGLKTKVEKE